MAEPSDFKTRPIEQPILNSQVRQQLNPVFTVNSGGLALSAKGGFRAFYQANRIYFWGILGGLAVIGLLSYFAFRKTPPAAPKEANVSLSIDAPDTVPSGSEAVYRVTIKNNDSNKLVNVQLELIYPGGFTYIDSSPAQPLNLSGTLFPVPELVPGMNAVVIVKARATGNVNDTKQLTAKLHYSYSNFNSEFVKEQQNSVRLVASDVVLELSGPPTANNAQLVVYDVKYQNNSGSDIQNARISLTYPGGFVFAGASPKPDLGNNIWNVGTLANNGSGDIQIQGNFRTVNPGESKIAQAEFQILGPDGNYFVQNSSSFTTAIASLPLLVSQSLQPDNPNNVVNPGDYLQFVIKYQNNSPTAATGANVTVTLNSTALDLSTITAEAGQVNNNSILWNAALVPQLAQLAPNASGQLSFRVKVKDPATRDSSKNLTIISDIGIKSNEYATPFPGNELSLKISSPSQIGTALDYSSGSLPPQVGKVTVYKVTLSLSNASNDYTNTVVTAFIPLASGAFDSTSVTPAEADKTQFDPSTGKLTWNVGGLPAHTGTFSQARVLSFLLKLSPSSSQAYQSPTLLNSITLFAKDSFTGQDVNVSAKDITTQSLTGSNNYGKGSVVP